jgi:hypothetical protein
MNHEIIESELKKIKADTAEISQYLDKPEWNRVETAGVAAIVASIYSGLESIFINLCEDKVKKSERWHIELFKNALSEGLISPDTENILREMLAFRHIQRNYYGHELRESEVRKKAVEIVTIITPAFEKHLKK